jgi:hypothetical protein
MALNCSASLPVTTLQYSYRSLITVAVLHEVKVKVKVIPTTGHEGLEGKQRYRSTLSLTSALDGCGCLMPRSSFFTPREQNRYALYSRLCGPRGQSGRVRRISPPTGIHSPDRPECSESLYRLSYRGPRVK